MVSPEISRDLTGRLSARLLIIEIAETHLHLYTAVSPDDERPLRLLAFLKQVSGPVSHSQVLDNLYLDVLYAQDAVIKRSESSPMDNGLFNRLRLARKAIDLVIVSAANIAEDGLQNALMLEYSIRRDA